MPIHDWTRVEAGIFHHFHHGWIEELQRALNAGLLPRDYYALAEQITGPYGPDVLALKSQPENGQSLHADTRGDGGIAFATKAPKTRITATTEMELYVRKQSRVVIRHRSGDEVIALIEVVSPGNKASRREFESFVDRAADALDQGYHLMLLDLNPPTPRDPQGIHGALWSAIADDSYVQPLGKPLTAAAYCSDLITTAYVEPLAVGDALPELPLFLSPSRYVPVPLESTYASAFSFVPERWRRVLE